MDAIAWTSIWLQRSDVPIRVPVRWNMRADQKNNSDGLPSKKYCLHEGDQRLRNCGVRRTDTQEPYGPSLSKAIS